MTERDLEDLHNPGNISFLSIVRSLNGKLILVGLSTLFGSSLTAETRALHALTMKVCLQKPLKCNDQNAQKSFPCFISTKSRTDVGWLLRECKEERE